MLCLYTCTSCIYTYVYPPPICAILPVHMHVRMYIVQRRIRLFVFVNKGIML